MSHSPEADVWKLAALHTSVLAVSHPLELLSVAERRTDTVSLLVQMRAALLFSC